jgi:tRNA(adenine34) deaminase
MSADTQEPLQEQNMLSTNHAAHHEYMRHALSQAKAALAAGEFPVGCIMVADGQILASGRRTSSKGTTANELDHAEIVALRSLIHNHPGLDMTRVTVYSTMEPCLMCFATMLLNGVRTFVYAYEDVMGGGTSLELSKLNPLYREMTVTVIPHILRDDSLLLFQEFFTKAENSYWQNSMLSRHTIAQKPSE